MPITRLKTLQVIIVEDHPMARDELKYLLSLHPDFNIVGEYADTASAWPIILEGKLDGVFLDIDIFEESDRAGLDLAYRIDRLGLVNTPWIVFTTAHEQHALEAHSVCPLGYLLKPLSDAKIARIMEKICKAVKVVSTRIAIKYSFMDRGESVSCTKYVTQNEIIYIQSNNNANTVNVHLLDGSVLGPVRQPLKNWIEQYALPNMLQIHKSHLVNLMHVNGIKADPFKEEGHNVTFRGCAAELSIGDRYLERLRETLSR